MLENCNQVVLRESRNYFRWVKLIACIFFSFLLFFSFLESFSLFLDLSRSDLFNFYLDTLCKLALLLLDVFYDLLDS